MSIYALKSRFQNLLRPAVVSLHGLGVTANQVTVIAAVLSVVVAGILLLWGNQPGFHWLYILVPAWMFVRMALNAIDGMLAREHHQQSTLGGYLNELGDIVSDAALYWPFAYLPGVEGVWVFVIIWLSAVVEMAGVLGQAVGSTNSDPGSARHGARHYHGPMGKSDRAFVFGALALWVAIIGVPEWTTIAFTAIIALLLVSLVRRVRAGLGGNEPVSHSHEPSAK